MKEHIDQKHEFIENLKLLSNLDEQKSLWLKNENQVTRNDYTFDMFISYWFDDMMLDGGSSSLMGTILDTNEQAACVDRITEAIECVFKKFGNTSSVHNYITSPEWSLVAELSRHALEKINPQDA